MEYIIIYCTVPNKKEGKEIATALVSKKLAACVNMIDKMESVFFLGRRNVRRKRAFAYD